MLICPECGGKTHVARPADPWNARHDSAYKRYRICDKCGLHFTTVERYAKDYKREE